MINRVLVKTHPKRKDPANVTIFELRDAEVGTDSAEKFLPGESKTLICSFTNPSDRNHRIGAATIVTRLLL